MKQGDEEDDPNHVRCRGAKSFVDDLGLSRGVVLSRAVHFCDLSRLLVCWSFVYLLRNILLQPGAIGKALENCQANIVNSELDGTVQGSWLITEYVPSQLL